MTLQPLVLTGPTACGKSALAMRLASEVPLEIISVDSALVYRGLDIGTAKPTLAERAAVPHHLIDILDPTEAYSAARFVADVLHLVPQIQARGRLPLLVGGTLLYVHALRQGLAAMPPADPDVRAAIDAEAAARGWPALHAELARVDPATAARLAPHDSQRVQRALEVWRSSGRTLSDWHAQAPPGPGPGAAWPVVSLEPMQRGWLHARIAERWDTMMAAGLLEEVRGLRARADLHAELPALRSVGYRQAWQALETGEMAPLRERAVAATRQLAKRQLTWLRSITTREPVACDRPDALDQGLRTVLRHAGAS